MGIYITISPAHAHSTSWSFPRLLEGDRRQLANLNTARKENKKEKVLEAVCERKRGKSKARDAKKIQPW